MLRHFGDWMHHPSLQCDILIGMVQGSYLGVLGYVTYWGGHIYRWRVLLRMPETEAHEAQSFTLLLTLSLNGMTHNDDTVPR